MYITQQIIANSVFFVPSCVPWSQTAMHQVLQEKNLEGKRRICFSTDLSFFIHPSLTLYFSGLVTAYIVVLSVKYLEIKSFLMPPFKAELEFVKSTLVQRQALRLCTCSVEQRHPCKEKPQDTTLLYINIWHCLTCRWDTVRAHECSVELDSFRWAQMYKMC